MTSKQRRDAILSHLGRADNPVSASALASLYGVSRQVVVGDIALLRAAGQPVLATPRGYIINRDLHDEHEIVRTIVCRHQNDRLDEELYAITDNGGAVLDVIVEHAVYGQITGQLQIFSHHDAEEFIQKLFSHRAPPLSKLTNGLHLHTVKCRDEESFHRICAVLRKKGILLDE